MVRAEPRREQRVELGVRDSTGGLDAMPALGVPQDTSGNVTEGAEEVEDYPGVREWLLAEQLVKVLRHLHGANDGATWSSPVKHRTAAGLNRDQPTSTSRHGPEAFTA
jgi:hypothetical protein